MRQEKKEVAEGKDHVVTPPPIIKNKYYCHCSINLELQFIGYLFISDHEEEVQILRKKVQELQKENSSLKMKTEGKGITINNRILVIGAHVLCRQIQISRFFLGNVSGAAAN